ncbi:MAG TPA: alginate export family protein, partial [Rhodanobacter sp.]|nr:alginate export family protein [Rhodanobacter sp.]
QDAGELSGYYSRWIRRDVHYADGHGNESRRIYDVRYAGRRRQLDWDVEVMAQRGTLGAEPVRAWALGAHVGYTPDTAWTARWGLQFDAASGDRHSGDGQLNTFNPLFPNGSYFTLGGYTGYSNLIHVKPSLVLHLAPGWSLMLGWGLQWRQTAGDGVYLQSGAVVSGTAGLRDRWTGMYGQGRVDWTVSRNLSLAVEAVHFKVGKAVREAGGRDGNYLGVEARLAW